MRSIRMSKPLLAISLFIAFFLVVAPLEAAPQQAGGAPAQPKISEDEQKALKKVQDAAGLQAKLAASTEYLKKYAKSTQRQRLATYMASEVAAIQDDQQRLQGAKSFTSTFNTPEEADLVKPTVIDTHIKMEKFDEAFQEAASYLQRQPDDVIVQTQLAIIGADQAQRQNAKFVQASDAYGKKAIQLMESDRKPERMSAEDWNAYRNQWLPRLYQSQGVISYMTGNKAGAKELFEKAVGLNDRDPVALMMVGMLADDEYQDIAKRYNIEKPGPGKDALLKEAYAKMDQVIDWFARSVAAADGKPEYAQMQQQLMQNLQSYYTSRHNGSTQGLKELIEKYKKPAGQ